jgi:4-amino-4-deoxy-L-arabinose transferase-like glycosyltransferase
MPPEQHTVTPEPIQVLTQRPPHPVGSVPAPVTRNRRQFISRRIDPIRIVLVLALCLGSAFCIVRFLHRPSLWLDEAMLSDNIVARSFWGLTQPLDYLQLAPIMFLWVERLMVTLLGPNEWALRFLPLLSAIALPPLAFVIAQKLVPRHCAVIAPLTLAVSPAIIHFAIETKPYASDALIGLTLLALAMAVLEPRSSIESNRSFTKARWLLALVGAAAPWIAFTSMFYLGAIAVVLLAPRFRVSPERLTKRFSLGIASVWLVSSIAAVAVASDESIVRGMHFYWKDNFLTTDLGAVFQISRIAGNLIRLSIFGGAGAQSGVMSPLMLAVALLILLLGIVDLWRRRPAYFVLLCGPLLAAFSAFALNNYPFADRLWLFAVPVLVLVFVVGIQFLVRRFPLRFQAASALSIARRSCCRIPHQLARILCPGLLSL